MDSEDVFGAKNASFRILPPTPPSEKASKSFDIDKLAHAAGPEVMLRAEKDGKVRRPGPRPRFCSKPNGWLDHQGVPRWAAMGCQGVPGSPRTGSELLRRVP
jgi:hypothetical protein